MHRRATFVLAAQLPLALLCAALLSLGWRSGQALEVRPLDVWVHVGPDLRQPALELPDAVRAALRRQDWAGAASALQRLGPEAFAGSARGDWAFVLAWSLVRAERGASAAPYLPLLDGADAVPPGYAALVRGEVLHAAGDHLDALPWLESVAPDHTLYGRAVVLRAESLRKLGRTQEAFALYETLIARPDPAVGTPEALLALAQHIGIGSPEAYPYLRRIWVAYPTTEVGGHAKRHLAAYEGASFRPTWQDVGRRAEILMDAGQILTAIAELEGVVGQVRGSDLDACRFAFVRGRSLYRRNELSKAIAAFGDVGASCAPDGAEYGAKILFLKGMAQYRKGEYTSSAATMSLLAERYPGDSLADDGLLHAGIAHQQAGRLSDAQAIWARALRDFPDGDTTPESTWRLAFSRYLGGESEAARETAASLAALPFGSDGVHVAAGMYWSARWALYPNVDAPRAPHAAGREAAVAGWRRLCEEHPRSFYAILAYSRLVEEAPEVAAALAKRPPDHRTGAEGTPWRVRQGLWEHPGARAAIDLARLGLIKEALVEWRRLSPDAFEPDEVAWMIEIRARNGDWLFAHDELRRWLKTHPAGTLGPNEPEVLRVAYPDRYWTEVQAATASARFEPRLFHALVREESNFNKDIVSPAGAKGLSQLMPATAREVAGWLGKTVTDEAVFDVSTNLTLGGKYFDVMHKQHEGSPYLSLAAYNAGGGRVKQWVGEWGNVPTDEFVERIPYKETRDYVKRVMGTWQIMRYQFDDGPAFPDLSPMNHKAFSLRD